MICNEDQQFTRDYYDPGKRAIANGITVTFKDGNALKEAVVAYPVGHKRRRNEGIPLLEKKFRKNLARHFSEKRQQAIVSLCFDQKKLEATPVDTFINMFVA